MPRSWVMARGGRTGRALSASEQQILAADILGYCGFMAKSFCASINQGLTRPSYLVIELPLKGA